MIVRFIIPGVPQQQGSKRYVGKGVSIEANKKLKPWRADAIAAAYNVHGDTEGPLFVGPVVVVACFYFPRPASHYGTGRNAGIVKPGILAWHASAPDLDKLMRAVGDVLTQAEIVRDDRLIAHWDARKLYGSPRVELAVREAT